MQTQKGIGIKTKEKSAMKESSGFASETRAAHTHANARFESTSWREVNLPLASMHRLSFSLSPWQWHLHSSALWVTWALAPLKSPYSEALLTVFYIHQDMAVSARSFTMAGRKGEEPWEGVEAQRDKCGAVSRFFSWLTLNLFALIYGCVHNLLKYCSRHGNEQCACFILTFFFFLQRYIKQKKREIMTIKILFLYNFKERTVEVIIRNWWLMVLRG